MPEAREFARVIQPGGPEVTFPKLRVIARLKEDKLTGNMVLLVREKPRPKPKRLTHPNRKQ